MPKPCPIARKPTRAHAWSFPGPRNQRRRSLSSPAVLLVALVSSNLLPCFVLGSKRSHAVEIAPVHLTLLDEGVIHYATFQSHNQKVVVRGRDVYTAHLRTRNEEYTAQTWRLSRSDDGGETFQVMCEETLGTNPPVLEIDDEGHLFLIRVDFPSQAAFLDRWPHGAARDASGRTTTRIPHAAAGKYAAMLDEPRDQIYFFSHNNTFHRLRTDGTLVDSVTLLKEGPNAILQYPQLALDEQGWLHLSWTTQKHGVYLYWDIHHILSTDGGATFRTMEGRPLELPIVADDTGPATRVSLDDEFEVHTWLSSSLARGGKWHGLYLAQGQPPRQHLVRYDLATGRKEFDRQPELRGSSIRLQGLDGYFVADRKNSRRLYVVGNDNGHLAALRSDDGGQTWQDHARSDTRLSLYSIGGYRWTTDEGNLVGTVTDQVAPESTTDARSRVYFFRIPGVPSSESPAP